MANAKAQFQLLSPEAQQRAGPAFDTYIRGLTDNLPVNTPENPNAAQQEFQQRAIAANWGAGVSPDVMRGIFGLPAPAQVDYTAPSGAKYPGYMVSQPGQAPYWTPFGSPSGSLAAPGGIPPGAPGAPAASYGQGPAPGIVGTSPGTAGDFGPGPMHGPTTAQSEFMKQQAETYKDLNTDMNTMANGIFPAVRELNTLQDSLQRFLAGPGATLRGKESDIIGTLGTAFGLSPEAMQPLVQKAMAGGTLDAQQLFHAVVNRVALQQLKSDVQGTGRVMKSEVDSALANISENMTPQTLERYLNTQVRGALMRDYDRVSQFKNFQTEYTAGHVNAGDFPMWYAERAMPDDRLAHTTTGGIDIGPRPEGEAMGVSKTPTGPQFTYDPTRNAINPYTAPVPQSTPAPQGP
jgi:hypothetical protein